MKRIFLKVTLVAILGTAFVVCNANSLIGEDKDQFSSSELHLQDSENISVAGISYNCHGSYTTDGKIISSSSEDMMNDDSPEYKVECTITPLMPQDYIYMTLRDESIR